MKASRRLTAKKYKDDQNVKNAIIQTPIVQQLKIEDVEPHEEQVQKTQIDEFLENVEPLSSIPNSKHRGYIGVLFFEMFAYSS